jgi:predicted lactoylglutathione lyase
MQHNLPTPKLADVSAITINSPDLEKSLKFYQQLGFSEIYRNDFPFPWIQVSDGVLLIMLRYGKEPYIALTYYVKELDKVVNELEGEGIVFTEKPKGDEMIKRYLFKSPDGLNVSLVTFVEGFYQPAGPGMLRMPPQDYSKPEKYVNKTCGLFGEFAQPVKDLEHSLPFWEKLGFKVMTKFTSPYPWAILSDGLNVIGLHQVTHFTQPTITYFAADMKDKVEKLKASGVEGFAEAGGGANFILSTPEKQNINLFKLGM